MPKVLFTEAARADIEVTRDWYGLHAPEAAARFLESLRAAVLRIGQNPLQFPAASHGTRRATLRRFPYLVLFRETPEAVVVVAVFHSRRNPQVWRRRLTPAD